MIVLIAPLHFGVCVVPPPARWGIEAGDGGDFNCYRTRYVLVVSQRPRHGEQALLPGEVEFQKVLNEDGDTLGLSCYSVTNLAFAPRNVLGAITFLQILEKIENGNMKSCARAASWSAGTRRSPCS